MKKQYLKNAPKVVLVLQKNHSSCLSPPLAEAPYNISDWVSK